MKYLFSIVILSVVFVTSSVAIELDTSRQYSSVALASESIENTKTGFAIILNGGAPIKGFGDTEFGSFVFEAEFTHSIIPPSHSLYESIYGDTFEEEIQERIVTLGSCIGYKLNFYNKVYIKPKIGVIFASVETSDNTYNSNDIYLSLGGEIGYRMYGDVDLYIGYTTFNEDDAVTHITLGVQYKY